MTTNGILSNKASEIELLYAYLSIEEREELDNLLLQNAYDWQSIARPNQIAPQGDWVTWLLLAGRGFGKTRSVCEWLRSRVEAGKAKRIGIVAPTTADYRDLIVLGESGLIACSPPWNKPIWNASNRSITWANGAEALCFSSAEPESLRGYQFDTLLCEELGSWKYQQETWDMAQMCLRLGDDPKCAISTTPKPQKLIKELINNPSVVVTHGSTYDNKDNLAKAFLSTIISKYEGTRLGRQELNAEILEDVEGALFTLKLIDEFRVKEAPDSLPRIVVGVDPSGSTGGNECGIVVAGRIDNKLNRNERQYYVLADYTIAGTPAEWAKAVAKAYEDFKADTVIAERNYGGLMVEEVLRQAGGAAMKVELVTATRGKAIRAEPISALYEQGVVHHVGTYSLMEDELTSWIPGESKNSPNRLDALVWAITALAGKSRAIKAYG